MKEEKRKTYAINFDNTHIMSLNPKEKHRKSRHINHSQPISLPSLKLNSRIPIKPNRTRTIARAGDSAGDGREVRTVLFEVD